MAKVKVIQVLSDRRAVFCKYIFHSSSILTLIWVSHHVVCWRAGFSAVPVLFLVIIIIAETAACR